MLTEFTNLPDDARIWIYQADKSLEADQVNRIEARAAEFCAHWTAHNTPLKSSYKVLHNKFLVLAVDESCNQASGCSIDTSVRFVQELEQQLGVSFFDRTQVAFLIDEHIYTTGLHNIKDEINAGKIARETLTFNLQAQNMAEFHQQWLVPAAESWMKRYFNA